MMIFTNQPEVKKTATVGQSHKDTVPFDHYVEFVKAALDAGKKVHIKSLELWSKEFVYGMVVTYKITDKYGKSYVTRVEMGKQFTSDTDVVHIDFEKDEYIANIKGRSGGLIDRLTIKTNKNREFELGGLGGDPFDFNIPKGSGVLCFGGGHDGHLHQLYAYYVKAKYLLIN